ncbi:MAG: hypothetical protein ABIA62_07680 [Candidatus Woesearchaeota archaeon]
MMDYLAMPKDGRWVAVNRSFAGDIDYCSIVSKIQRTARDVQVWFHDLDDNHAKSPAKDIAMRAVGTGHLSSDYISWCAGTAIALAKQGKSCETERWRLYVDKFLRGTDAREQLKAMFTPERVCRSLYLGVRGFCSLFPAAGHHYVSRNIDEVVSAYASALDFDISYPESDQKHKVVEKFIFDNPQIEKYAVDGDSAEDAMMIDVLRHYRKDVIGFYSMDASRESDADEMFDVFTGKDRTGIVDILKESS